MKSQYVMIGGVLLIIVIVGFITLGNPTSGTSVNVTSTSETNSEKIDEDVMMEDESMMAEDDAMMKDDAMMEDGSMMQEDDVSRYGQYSDDALEVATGKGGRAVLFFAALGWCPSCQAADKDFKANFDQVPDDVTVLIVDYDENTALKQKYRIAQQDTFVQVDENGEELTRWNGGGKGVDSLLANIQ